MAIKMIRNLPDPVLRQACREFKQVTPQTLKLLDDLRDTLYAEPGRAGLAAPQIGISKRAAVLDMGDGEGLIELINPEIVERSGEQTGYEGCLSMPKLYGSVTRAAKVRVRTLTRTGEEKEISAEGHTAVCLQHEIDHLDGILYIDHVAEGQLFHEADDREVSVLEMIRLSRSGQ